MMTTNGLGDKLNVLRAGVLGAQDGIVSTAGLVIGVAGASANSVLLIAGLAGLVSGSLSMAGGEYVSVCAQRDTEVELNIDPSGRVNPWNAALTSAITYAVGAALPLLAITLSPATSRIPITFIVVIVALIATGWLSAVLGGAPRGHAVLRNVGIGALTMLVTYGIGTLVGRLI